MESPSYGSSAIAPAAIVLLLHLGLLFPLVSSLGAMATLSISSTADGLPLVCFILRGQSQLIQCATSSNSSSSDTRPSPAIPFLGLSSGARTLCALRSDTLRPLCWDTSALSAPRRLKNAPFQQLVAGDSHVCALSSSSNATSGGLVSCWRNRTIQTSTPALVPFVSLASGRHFVCGLKASDGFAQCWGALDLHSLPNASFQSLQAGSLHACGLTRDFDVQCWGDNSFHQLNPPTGQFLTLALGERHSCGIDAFNRSAVCWGDRSSHRTAAPAGLAFATIAAGDSFTCGVISSNLSIFCWGAQFGTGEFLDSDTAVPSFCSSVACDARSFQAPSNISGGICANAEHVCLPCRLECPNSVQTSACTAQQDITCALSPGIASAPSPALGGAATTKEVISRLSKGLIALTVLGSLGCLCGVLAVGWCVWAKFYGPVGFSLDGSQGRVHNSAGSGTVAVPSPRIKRQRSSTSSVRSRGDMSTGRAQAFTLDEMAAATMGFSDENRIGAGSFGVVYKGMLPDGREVAIKRGDREAVANDRKVEEKESAFQSELEMLSRLHHKHLVSLVGYCDEEDERMLVYDFMPNGTLHDHLHGRAKGVGGAGALAWQMRIKIALEAARGVEYLHTYALPPIIHRDIKSSNILLDGGWSARVSDFGLSTRGPGENSHLSLMAAGTLGYMDPEYYRLQHLTIKSDVYSFGVVLLELLTGERAIHKQSHGPVNIVDFAVPRIAKQDLVSILDQRPAAPEAHELRALQILAQVAAKCVRLEGKERPTMTEIVGVLEEVMAYGSNGRSRSQSITMVAGVAAADPAGTAHAP